MLAGVQLVLLTVITVLVATRASADNSQGRRKVFSEQINTFLFFLHTWGSSWGKCLSLFFYMWTSKYRVLTMMLINRLAHWFPTTAQRLQLSTVREQHYSSWLDWWAQHPCNELPEWVVGWTAVLLRVVADDKSYTCFSKSWRGLLTKWFRGGCESEYHGTEWSDSGNLRIFTSNGSSHLDSESEVDN